MFLRKRKQRDSEFSDLDRASRELMQKISELEEMVGQGSPVSMHPQRNTLPPPDRVRQTRQQNTLKVAVARGNVRNARRELHESTALLLVLICSIAASTFWIIRLLDQG
ncbi:hypothetical protein QET93_006640 [Akkermansia sp. N21116]|jgi:hypothetical protein|uniref:hypothetical protein n=1 Tax=Akkermansia sp. N21116 TaxID=3040764 RepID=UPI00244E762D|nr:hypothetical protein [Akkermansia sp. N21116]WPX41768.1 hypothetical protein QET93_006640 [Akkermansia sp. N21116]